MAGGVIFVRQMRGLLFCMAVLLSGLFPTWAAAAIGDSKAQVQQLGPCQFVQDVTGRIWLAEEWRGAGRELRSYGYAETVNGMAMVRWVEFDSQQQVRKEQLLFADSLTIRKFAACFPELHRELSREDSRFILMPAPRKAQPAVIIRVEGEQRLVRFFLADETDRTSINLHTQLRGVEITPLEETAGAAVLRDQEWREGDNYFLNRVFFSERLVPRRETDLIVIHHTAGDGGLLDVHALHLRRGWAGIGYHKLIQADGTVLAGRPEGMVGAHAAKQNDTSLGVALVGNFEQRPPTEAQLTALVQLVAAWQRQYGIPAARVVPHRAVTPGTVCPGKLFPWPEFLACLAL